MNTIEHRISNFLKEHHIDGNRLLLACSGGVDSMTLLHGLLKTGHKPAVAHCNFQLRGAEADKDAAFVKDYCTKHGLAFFIRKFDTASYAAEKKISIQMAARELRYSFFQEVLAEHTLDFLAVAHHADDSLETILLNLGRGTGLTGLAGIRAVTAKVVRPMHLCTKKEILEYAHQQQLQWREDASNEKEDYQRNQIRISVAPRLREVFPSFESSFTKSLTYLDEDRQLFESLLNKELELLTSTSGDEERLNIRLLLKTGNPKALLRHWLFPKAIFDLNAIFNSLTGESGSFFESGEWQLLKDRDVLILKRVHLQTADEFLINENDEAITLPFPMKMERKNAATFELSSSAASAALDFQKLVFPLKLRRWKKGDRFRPFGMKGAKKLSDYFVDRKYSRFDKDNAWLLCSGDDIVWIVNDRIDDRYKISNTTKTVYFARLL